MLSLTGLKVAGVNDVNVVSILTRFKLRFSLDGVTWNIFKQGNWDAGERVSFIYVRFYDLTL